MINPISLFPYKEARPFQDELIQRIYSADKILCNAPTGVGKSISALCGFLAERDRDEKIVILTRTKSQAKIFLQEIAKISQHSGQKYLAIQLRSKQELCPFYRENETTYEEFIELCKATLECPYREKFFDNWGTVETLAEEISSTRLYADYSNLLPLLRSRGCPYLVLQELSSLADVLVTSYLYLLNPFLRRIFLNRIQKEIEDLLIIIDEAHNLHSMDILGKTLSRHTLDMAAKEIDYDFSSIYFIFDGKDDILEVEDYLDHSEVAYLLDKGREVLRSRLKQDKKVSYTFRVASFFKHALEYSMEGNWMFFRKEGKLYIKPLFPNEFIEPLRNSRKLLMMSGTLEPLEGFKLLYGLEDAEDVSLPKIFPKENSYYLGVKGINTAQTTRENRGEELWKDYAGVIQRISNASPMTTLVFFPSYDIMYAVAKYLNEVGLEPADSAQAEDFWKQVVDKGQKKVFAVSGGKFSEGVEFTINKGNEKKSVISTLIIAGFPFPVPDFELEIKSKFYEERFGYGRAFLLLSVLPMVNKVLQAIGRAVRSENDRAAIVLLDDRLEYLKYFPESISNEIQICEMDELADEVAWFHSRLKGGF
jgi:DNA excision repair protein ERCC-2